MNNRAGHALVLGLLMAGLAGCASGPGGIYVPADREQDVDEAPAPPEVDEDSGDQPARLSDQPPRDEEPVDRRGYQEQGDELSPAAASLIRQADSLMAGGNAQAAVSQLERAQRISPRSAQVYFKLSEAYVATNSLGAAEQFTLKGLSLSGSNTHLQKSGWQLLADIRRERGNTSGAEQAERRAAAL